MILQSLNYTNKNKATDEENALLVDAWNSLKTRIYSEDLVGSKEGITYQNFATFIHVINYIFPQSLFKKPIDFFEAESDTYEARPFGHISDQGLFFVSSPQETFKIHLKYRSFVHTKKYLETLVHSSKKENLLFEE